MRYSLGSDKAIEKLKTRYGIYNFLVPRNARHVYVEWDKINEWCRNNFGTFEYGSSTPRWEVYAGGWLFREEADYLLFLLRWG